MFLRIIISLLTISTAQTEFKTDQVSIEVDIHSNIYSYKVTNLSSSPIVDFQIGQHAAYNFIAPDGWNIETAKGLFRAWTDDTDKAIQPKNNALFSMRVSSRGASLNAAPVVIKFKSDTTVQVPHVWYPAPEPRSHIILVVSMMLLIILTHTAIVLFKASKQKKISSNDA